MAFKAFISNSSGLITAEALFANLNDYLRSLSFEFFSYHITAAQLKRLNLEAGFITNNFPPDWVAHYIAKGYYAYDPIIQAASRHEEPFHWFEVGKIATLTPDQSAYLKDLAAWGFKDGVAVPIFSAKGTTAYFGAGSKSRELPLDPVDLTQIQFACHFTHKRYLELYGAVDGEVPDLSKREIEVLGWIAKGKSTGVIAEILGVTDHTVDTLTRRIYQKLGVNDRISAVLKAVGSGLISL
jgi:LuxR family transcriptional regulator, quorum-sensing system regulator CciR